MNEPNTSSADTTATQEPGLSEQEKKILNVEKKRWKYPAAKEGYVLMHLNLKPIAYYQALNKMLDDPRVYAAEPALVSRLRAAREG